MWKFPLFIAAVLVAVLCSVNFASAWPTSLSSWSYRRPIDVNVSDGSTLTDFQVLLNVTYDADMQTDFDDLRFMSNCSDDAVALDYWIEYKVDSSYADVWVEVDTINTTICMYYGNPSASSAENGTATFPLHFEDSENYNTPLDYWTHQQTGGTVEYSTTEVFYGVNSTKMYTAGGAGVWNEIRKAITPSTNIVVSTRFWDDATDTTRTTQFRAYDSTPASVGNMGVYTGVSTTNYVYYDTAAGSYVTTTVSRTTGWHLFEIATDGTTVRIYIDGVEVGSYANSNSIYYVVYIEGGSASSADTFYIDNSFIRKYNSVEPTYTIGAEETASTNNAPVVTIYSPVNNGEYNQSNINITFKATDIENATFTVNVYADGVNIYSNTSYENNTVIYLSHTFTSEGFHNITVSATDQNDPPATTNETVNITLHAYHFYAKDSETSSLIQNFSITFTNGTVSTSNSTTNYEIWDWADNLPNGNVNVTVQAYGYETTTFEIQINTTDWLNITFSLDPASLTIRVYDEERTYERIKSLIVEFDNGTKIYDYGTQKSYESNATTGSVTINTSAAYIFDSDWNTYTLTELDGAGDYYALINGTMYLGNALSQICINLRHVKSGITGSLPTTSYYIYFQNTTGDWIEIGSWSLQSGDIDSTYTHCYDVNNSDYKYGKLANVSIKAVFSSPATGYVQQLYFYEIYPVIQSSNGDLVFGLNDLVMGTTEVTIEDSNGNYAPRSYYLTINAYSRLTLDAYLPKYSDGIVNEGFYISNIFGNPINGATVSARRKYDGTWVTVGQDKTDVSGMAYINLISGRTYRIVVDYQGSTMVYGEITATSTTIPIVFNESLSINFSSLFNDISIRVLPFENVFFLEKGETSHNETFRFYISNEAGELELFGMRLVCNGTSEVYVSNVTTSPSGGEITYTYDVANCENITMEYYFKKSGYDLYWKEKTYYVEREYNIGLVKAVDLIKSNVSESEYHMLSVLILMIVAAGLSVFSPEVAALGEIMVGGILTYSGLLEWSIYLIITLAMLAVMLIRRRWL